MFSGNVQRAIRSGSGIQDYLNLLNKDGVEELFDDFDGDLLKDEWAETTGTGAASVAGGLCALATTASDAKGTGLIGDARWSADKGCMVEARFAVDQLDCKIEFGWVNAEGTAELGVVNDADAGTIQTATEVAVFVYDIHATAATLASWHTVGAKSAGVVRNLYGAQAASATNDATTTTYTVAGTPFAASALIGQRLWVPAYAAGTRREGQYSMLPVSNTTSVITGTTTVSGAKGAWEGGRQPPDNLGYGWGNIDLALGVPVAATYHTFTVKLQPSYVAAEVPEALFLIDGVLAARMPGAVTATTTALCPYIQVAARSATEAILSVDYIRAIQSRRA